VDQNFAYTGYLKLFKGETGAISLGVGSNAGADELFQMVEDVIRAGASKGWLLAPEGVDSNELLQEIDGWVLGEKSDGEPCVYLYKSPLKWKVATVWFEKLHFLPWWEREKGSAKLWPGGAPERDVAESKGYLNRVSNVFAVLEKTGEKSQSGRDVTVFSRIQGYTAKEQTAAMLDYEALYGQLTGTAKSLADNMRKASSDKSKPRVSWDSLEDVQAMIDTVCGKDGASPHILWVLTGSDPKDGGMSAQAAEAIRKHMPETITGNDGEEAANPDYSSNYASVMAFVYALIERMVADNRADRKKSGKAKSAAGEDIPF